MARRGVPPIVIVSVLFSLVLLGGGAYVLFTQRTGTPARATVTECNQSRRNVVCSGTWVAGGGLVGGDGRVVLGTIDGASSDDLGQTIDVRLSGDRAYTTSLRLPLILLGSGVTVLVLAGYELRRQRRMLAPPARPAQG
jgi:hypothetical protein